MDQKISVVVTGRNDHYIIDNINRISSYLKSLKYAFVKFDLEIIFVEYNNPIDRPHLYEEINDPSVRWIIVPPDIHNDISTKSEFDMHEYLAKNIGARRATGEFLLIGNPDVTFPNRFPTERLVENVIYFGSKRHVELDGKVRDIKPPTTQGAIGDFLIIDKNSFFKTNGFREEEVRGVADTVFAEDFVKSGGRVMGFWEFLVWHVDHHVCLPEEIIGKRAKRDESRKVIKKNNIKENDDAWGCKGIVFEEIV